MANFHLAQLNIALMRAPLESPLLADFAGNLDRINRLAETSPGFVWRLKDDDSEGAGNATAVRPFGEEILVNLSTWQDLESLRRFVFKSAHSEIMRRRGEWFHRMENAYTVLWWIPVDHRPTIEDAGQRLTRLREEGPTVHAFGFREPFAAPLTAEDILQNVAKAGVWTDEPPAT